MRFSVYSILGFMFMANILVAQGVGDKNLKGDLKNGKKHGKWIEMDSTGRTIGEFQYVNGVLEGPFMVKVWLKEAKHKDPYTNPDTLLSEFTRVGNYRNGKLHGEIKVHNETGQVKWQGTYRNNLRHGEFRAYHASGDVKIIANRKQDSLHGVWEYYWAAGQMTESRVYDMGKVVSSEHFSYFKNGVVSKSTQKYYVDGQTRNHGYVRSYYEDGGLMAESYYHQGKPDKTWRGYYQNGNLLYEMVYKNQKLVSYIEYDEEGNEKKPELKKGS